MTAESQALSAMFEKPTLAQVKKMYGTGIFVLSVTLINA